MPFVGLPSSPSPGAHDVMPRFPRHRLPLVLALAVVAPAVAQPASVDPEPLDQAVEDLSQLSMSLREIDPGLQQPTDFARVFRVKGGDELYRQQGGLYAVFPESRYSVKAVKKKLQLQPVIPPDTVFYIGRPALLDPEPPPAGPRPKCLVQCRIDARVPPPREDAGRRSGQSASRERWPSLVDRAQPACRAPLPAIVSDETYRTRRLHELLRYAARGRSSSSK
jgi:hypothetical protein